ncbi:hypothetical protein FDP41_005944 [Naegleria fowleri]|uniref:Uncharacterized protein n=1 Tax=Naegleria fowleri TaxID=5763 RepID=A0A6A5BLG5_NAEFO|nr:uncharacterized protein FDP41_005944 [Naegleria fowleri]KAF0975191.1 hypothetical protein FDP41_005944 [Naegleria fowleri]CAG4709427.1 unnamed protein product [Naegleria fowleri]
MSQQALLSAQDYSSDDDDQVVDHQQHQYSGLGLLSDPSIVVASSREKDLDRQQQPPLVKGSSVPTFQDLNQSSSLSAQHQETTTHSDPAVSSRFQGMSSHASSGNQEQGFLSILLFPYMCFMEGFSKMVRWVVGGRHNELSPFNSSSRHHSLDESDDLTLQSEGYSQV